MPVSRWRDIRDRARRVLHEHFEVPARYIPPGGGAPVDCTIRVHPAQDALTDVPGTAFDYATRWEPVPRLVFLREQVVPQRDGVVAVSAEEAYTIDHVEPVNGITVEARCSLLPPDKAAQLPYP